MLRITAIADVVVPDGKSLVFATTRDVVSAVGLSFQSRIKLASLHYHQHSEPIHLDHAEEGDCGP